MSMSDDVLTSIKLLAVIVAHIVPVPDKTGVKFVDALTYELVATVPMGICAIIRDEVELKCSSLEI